MSETILNILTDWSDEFRNTLTNQNPLSVALFSTDKQLLFASEAISIFFNSEPTSCFINPTFDKILLLSNSETLIFEGFITLGDYSDLNNSIWAQIYRKENKLLILGGINSSQLIEQNKTMHNLNREVSNLQRNLIKEKLVLESTLNQLNKANSDLIELNSTKDKFFSIIAHDLRNPFNALLNYSELLVRNAPKYTPEKIQFFASEILNTSKQTYSLLENLLEWASLQKGDIQANPVILKPSEIINDLVFLCNEDAKNKNIVLQTFVNNNDFVFADIQMLKSILRNLITNAIKFTHKQGIVKIITQIEEKEMLFIVSDNGTGIDEKHLAKIFNLDCKLSKSGTANEKGTGLGLILCKEFVEKNNGKIWVDSILGKGTEFKFTIPLLNENTIII